MYRAYFEMKGTDVTVRQAKKEMLKEFDENFVNDVFEDMEDDEMVLSSFKGWAEEKDGKTLFLEEIF